MINMANEVRSVDSAIDLDNAQRLSALGELATGLAQEVQQRLTVIANYANGCVHRLENDRITTEELKSLMKEISATAMQANEITCRAKKFSKKQYPEFALLDLGELIAETVEFIQGALEQSRINFDVQLTPELAEVFADRMQISQVLLNLIANSIEALQAHEENRNLCLKTFLDDQWVRVMVEDSGPGIPGEIQLLIFDPFFTTKSNGLGIGLGLCRSIIEGHRGQIQLDSEQGQGTRISFLLPRADRK